MLYQDVSALTVLPSQAAVFAGLLIQAALGLESGYQGLVGGRLKWDYGIIWLWEDKKRSGNGAVRTNFQGCVYVDEHYSKSNDVLLRSACMRNGDPGLRRKPEVKYRIPNIPRFFRTILTSKPPLNHLIKHTSHHLPTAWDTAIQSSTLNL